MVLKEWSGGLGWGVALVGIIIGIMGVPAGASTQAQRLAQGTTSPAIGEPEPAAEPLDLEQMELEQNSDQDLDQDLDIDPALIESSPLLQRWQSEPPDVLTEIRRDPSFRTRLRLGYSQFPANEQGAGFNVGVDDVFIGRTGMTVSGGYQATFDGEREAYGADLHYYLLPLGGVVNVAPVVGYRAIETDRYTTDGVNVGVRLRLVPSRTGAADITLTQSWVAPGTNEEVGISTLSVGYAVTPNLRLATDLEKQNAPARKDSRVAVVLEWMLE